jgi:hypothetical protein
MDVVGTGVVWVVFAVRRKEGLDRPEPIMLLSIMSMLSKGSL